MTSRRRFVADAMLGSLARKLRIFGFDTLYFKDGSDSQLRDLARDDARTILTADLELFERSRRERLDVLLVRGRTDRERLVSIRQACGPVVSHGEGRPSRCAVCNGEIVVVPKRSVSKKDVPAKALATHRLFFRCKSCSRFYWRGSHWRRLRPLSRSLTKPLT